MIGCSDDEGEPSSDEGEGSEAEEDEEEGSDEDEEEKQNKSEPVVEHVSGYDALHQLNANLAQLTSQEVIPVFIVTCFICKTHY